MCVSVLGYVAWLDAVECRQGLGERIPLIHPGIKAKKGASYVSSGRLRVRSAAVTPQPSFLDYITGGCELNFMVCVCVCACVCL